MVAHTSPASSQSDYAKRVDETLAAILEEARETANGVLWSDYLWPLVQSCTAGGKRLRPVLTLIACRGYAGTIPEPVWSCAAAAELFHTFALIHDDIIDDSAVRRGGPSMVARLKALGPGVVPRESAGKIAMLLGDALHALAVRTFVAEGLPTDRLAVGLRLLSEAAVLTGMAATEELVLRNDGMPTDAATVLELYDRKTGVYSFTCPLQVGAVLGGAPLDELPAIAKLGHALGRAFQIKDDIEDVTGFLRDGSGLKPRELRVTLPVVYAVQRAERATRDWIDTVTASNILMTEDLARLRKHVLDHGAINESIETISRCMKDASHAVEWLTIDDNVRRELMAYCRGLVCCGAPGE